MDTLPRTKRLKNPTATAKDDPQDGTDSLPEALKLLVFQIMGVETCSFLPNDQGDRGNLPRAKVRRAIVGRIPLASKFW